MTGCLKCLIENAEWMRNFESPSSQSMDWITGSSNGCNDQAHYVCRMSQFFIVRDVSMTTFLFLSVHQWKQCSPQTPHVKFHLYLIWRRLPASLLILAPCAACWGSSCRTGSEYILRRMQEFGGDECYYESDNRHWGEKWPCAAEISH